MTAPDPDPARQAARQRRADERLRRVASGVAGLDRWMEDLVRRGLAGLDGAGGAAWTRQARRLVDAQAGGLARSVAAAGQLVGAVPNWPELLLAELGRIALLTEAFARLDDLPEPLAAEVRRRVGWSVRRSEVLEQGEHVVDRWVVLGRHQEQGDELTTRRDWLSGERSGRVALVLQFAYGDRPFDTELTPGTVFEGALAFFAAANPQRAVVGEGTPGRAPVTRLPGADDIDALLDEVSRQVALDPWLRRTGGAVRDVVPVPDGERWWLRDRTGRGLRLLAEDPWTLLALSGGHPVDVAVEWSGGGLRPLACTAAGTYVAVS